MFENLKAAYNAKLTLGNLADGRGRKGSRTWSCDILFYGARVGRANGDELARELNVAIDEQLQNQIIDALKSNGFKLDLTKTPRHSIHPDSPANFMRLAIAQIADEFELAQELKLLARDHTLVLIPSRGTKVAVYDVPFSVELKAELIEKFGPETIEFVNEELKGI